MTGLERLGENAERELARFQAAPGLLAVVEAWPGVVGEEIARNAWPARIARDGTLHVSTTSSTWAFELTQLEGDVRARLAAEVGEGVPKKLRFAPGPLPAPAAAPASKRAAEPPAASAESREQAESLAAEIENEELRKMVARAAAASLERASTDRPI